MKKVFAVAMTAALALPVAATTAAAQDETISIEGRVYLDRNGNSRYDEGEVALAGDPGGTIVKADSGERVAKYATDAEGRYRVENLPPGRYRVESPAIERYNAGTSSTFDRTTTGGTVDVRLYGSRVIGYSYVDANLDHVRQPDEQLLDPGTLNGKPLPAPDEKGYFELNDLPFGDYAFVPADHSARNLRPVGTTGSRTFKLERFNNVTTFDLRHAAIKGDLAVDVPVLTPAKDVYVLGEEADVVIRISNKGEAAEKASFVLASYDAETLSHSDNVVAPNGTGFEFESKDPIAPGGSVDVRLRIRFTKLEIQNLHVIVRPSKFFKDPFQDNVAFRAVRVVEKAPETTTPSTPSPTTTTTTTAPAVAQEGNKSGLASTGASPLGFLGLGALLLAAGTGAFLVARRRRS
ncbi:SdrD B-like domain-containing protein [Lentzea sp. DG1S-22]|uniref:SdrD B-like domain-containing protein n=1 Tax=Lentzea sp. DG1S-22 TaxID=3108822 RepID=UPI002E78341B|nr:SdrD B-like domain-containing protein [Lentzea sp. DG1S-22]WVH79048.1 SdrD B-like domain-containing protein [Lentzea sp. DG1S-22]